MSLKLIEDSISLELIIGKTYYHNNIAKGYLIWELIGFDLKSGLAYLKHPETRMEFTTQISMLKITNRINNKPYYYENKTIKKSKKEIFNRKD